MADIINTKKVEQQFKFFTFWYWQYNKRNEAIISAAHTVRNCTDKLYDCDLLTKPTINNIDRYFQGDFNLSRKATPDEQMLLDSIYLAQQRLWLVDSLSDVLECPITSDVIIRAAHSQDRENKLYEYTPGQLQFFRIFPISHGKRVNSADGKTTPEVRYSFDIDIHAPDDLIEKALAIELYAARCSERGCSWDEHCGDDCFYWKECRPESTRKREAELIHAMFCKGPMRSFKSDSFAPRAIGLWLWDYCQGRGGPKKHQAAGKAIKAFEVEVWPTISKNMAFPDERQLRHYLSKTAACIAAGTILPFSTPRSKNDA